MTDTVHAECLCGKVRIACDLPSLKAGHCHCANCRRAHGAGVWTWVTFKPDQVRVVQGQDVLRAYTSTTEAVREFCGECGSTLTFASPRWPDTIDITRANFVESIDREADGHVYADRAPDWCPVTGDMPQFGGPDGSVRLNP